MCVRRKFCGVGLCYRFLHQLRASIQIENLLKIIIVRAIFNSNWNLRVGGGQLEHVGERSPILLQCSELGGWVVEQDPTEDLGFVFAVTHHDELPCCGRLANV